MEPRVKLARPLACVFEIFKRVWLLLTFPNGCLVPLRLALVRKSFFFLLFSEPRGSLRLIAFFLSIFAHVPSKCRCYWMQMQSDP